MKNNNTIEKANNNIKNENNSIKHSSHNLKVKSKGNNVHKFLANRNIGPEKFYQISTCNWNFTNSLNLEQKNRSDFTTVTKSHTNTCQPPKNSKPYFQPPEGTTPYFQEPKYKVLNSVSSCYYVPQQSTSCIQPCNQPFVFQTAWSNQLTK